MEFQAVILAAGRGSRMADLTATTPKALLPVANIPMVWYPINMLEKAGFPEAIIIVLESEKNEIQKAMVEYNVKKIQLEYVTIPDEEDWGTAESLRHISDKIVRDVLVVSCDLITDVSLHLLADVHRTNDATITMLLAQCADITDMAVPGGKANRKIEKDFAGLDEKGDRVLFISPEADLEESIQIKKSFFKRYPYVNMKTKLVDSHLYLVKKRVFRFLHEQKSLSAFKGEMIPYLVRKQTSKSTKTSQDATEEKKDIDTPSNDDEDVFITLAKEMSSYSDTSNSDNIKCYCYMMDGGLCLRANSLLTYCEANRQAPKQLAALAPDKSLPLVHPNAVISEKTQTGQDSMVGEGSHIGERCGVKKSVIGKFCKIADKVKIANCVIMDHVTIEEGCVLSGCVVCCSATLGEKCELKDCLVGNSQNVMSMGKFTNEIIVDRERMMEIM